MIRLSHKPQQYIRGFIEFYKLKFHISPDVLIPRPETELLVDEVLSFARSNLAKLKLLTILDIGTGCGNIAISIAKNLNLHPKGAGVKIIATDISQKALKVARQNAKLHGVDKQIRFIKSDLLPFCHPELGSGSINKIPKRVRNNSLKNQYIIVTNLPYIPSQRIPYLDSSVKNFEPHIALDGGHDGFELYRKLFKQISNLQTRFVGTNPNPVWKLKLIVGEIDYTHGELARNEALRFFPEAAVYVKTDLAKKQRFLLIKF